ncbi:MAG TPA: TAXI family TRAP transporter solute-binding subunit, partial [Polyangia bacterium]
MKKSNISGFTQFGFKTKLSLFSWRGLLYRWLPMLVVLFGGLLLVQKLMHPATIRILSGIDGSSYRNNAEKYKKIIERHGVKVVVLPSHGALENLQQLANPKVKADVGFVQGGLIDDSIDISHLFSLGSMFAQPLMVYYRSKEPVETLSQLKGKRLAIGPEGSGARTLALKLLKANEMDGPPTVLHELAGEEAANELIAGTIDAAFMMGDSATPAIMRKLRNNDDIEIANFRQADGYLRKFKFLSKLTLPEGAYDLGKNEPPRTLTLVGPTVELVARNNLDPALSDLLIGAAREVHSGAGMFRNAGEYPAPLARDFPISPDAERYYKSGSQFLYKKLPFWLANLLARLVVIVVPLLVILVPATKLVPAAYKWLMRS